MIDRGRVGRWLLVLLPLLLGSISWLALRNGIGRNELVTVQATLGDWLLALGLLLSIVMLIFLLVSEWRRRAHAAELEEKQQVALSDRRRFLQRLDHELKNPLTAIRAALANISLSPSNDPPNFAPDNVTSGAITSLNAQAVRLSRLTADLRKIAEMETRPLEAMSVDLSELLHEVFELAEEREGVADRQLILNIPQAPWPLPVIAGDQDLLFLAIYNLVDNALKFTRAGDRIEVRAREEGDTVLIEVADTGPGIEVDALPLIWDELYRADSARSVLGSGLGLALVKAIVERHSGAVQADSRMDQGTVMAIRLPVTNS